MTDQFFFLSMMRLVSIMVMLLATSCINKRGIFIDAYNVEEIQVTSRLDSSFSLSIKDPADIKKLLTGCLSNARQESVKVLMNYRLVVKEKDTSYTLLVRGEMVNLQGSVYHSQCNIEAIIDSIASKRP